MDTETYRKKRELFFQQEPQYRRLCAKCIQPEFTCYCSLVRAFDPKINFVILIHPIEVRRRIATGRMSHLCLENSHLIAGQNYSTNNLVNNLIADPEYHSVILYPGANSINVSDLCEPEKRDLCPIDKKLRIFVIDGTWATAKKMLRQSQNLHQLPRICFSPEKPSTFRVRKQPSAHCYSTIEAIHQTLELLGFSQEFNTATRTHDVLLRVFDSMVEKQLEFIRRSQSEPGFASYRRPQKIAI